MSKEHDPPPSQLTLEDVTHQAQETLLKDGYHVPTLILEGYGQALAVQVTPLAERSDEKLQQLQHVGFALSQQENKVIPQQVFLITEGWLSTPRAGETVQVRPSQDPARKEALIVSRLAVRERGARARVYEMIRDGDQHLVRLSPFRLATMMIQRFRWTARCWRPFSRGSRWVSSTHHTIDARCLLDATSAP